MSEVHANHSHIYRSTSILLSQKPGLIRTMATVQRESTNLADPPGLHCKGGFTGKQLGEGMCFYSTSPGN